MSGITFDTILAIIGLAFSAGGFFPVFFMREKKKEIAVAAVLVILLSVTATAVVRNYQRDLEVKRAEHSIVEKLGTEAKTLDQLYAEIKFCSLPHLNEALDHLTKNEVVGYRVKEVYDENHKPLLATIYFVNMNR